MPDWASDLRAHIAGLRLSPAREAEIIEELSQHLDDRYEELRMNGAGDGDARRQALDELNDSGGLRSRLRGLAQSHTPVPIAPAVPDRRVLFATWHDLRHAARTIRRQPGVAVVIIGTLALGIAVNTLVFTLVNGAVIRPLPFENPEQLVRLRVTTGDVQRPVAALSSLEVQDWQQARRTFEHIAIIDERRADVSGHQQPPVTVQNAITSWNLFALLRVPPMIGRVFRADDDRPGAPPVAIIAAALWRARYGADPGLLGTTIRIDGVPTTIVGVMPEGIGFPDRAQLWMPLAALSGQERESRGARQLDAVGRLRSGVTIEQARSELAGIAAALAGRYPETNRNVAPLVEPVGIGRGLLPILIALLGAVGFVLLIACANVANLLLARAADRVRDVSLRLALGASRWRIVRQLLVESLVLALAGGALGLALSHAGLQLLLANLEADALPPSWIQFTVDRTVFTYVAALCLGSALVCVLAPAWQVSRPDLVAALNDTGRAETGSRNRRRWTGAFVVAQVALTLMLSTGAMLMMRNLADLLRLDIGVNASELVQTGFVLQRAGYTPERRRVFVEQLQERFTSGPGIAVALASHAPNGGAQLGTARIEGQPSSASAAFPDVSLVDVGQFYFDVLGAPVIAGRVFDVNDGRRPVDRVVVNERFARIHFGDQSAIGQRVLLRGSGPGAGDAGQWVTIIGVVGNVRQRMLPSNEFDPVVYRVFTDEPPQNVRVVARSTSAPEAIAGFVRSQVQALDQDLPLSPIVSVQDAFALAFWPQRTFGSLFVAFAVIAMLLATCGLYGVTSYAVARRTREIGVRVALGADARRILWAVTRTTLRQLAIGILLGTAGAAAVATVLPADLVGTGADPVVFAAAVWVLVIVGVAASGIPARRALRLDAATALQTE